MKLLWLYWAYKHVCIVEARHAAWKIAGDSEHGSCLTKLFDSVHSPAAPWSLGLTQLDGVAAKQFHDNVVMPLISAVLNELASMGTVLQLLQNLQQCHVFAVTTVPLP